MKTPNWKISQWLILPDEKLQLYSNTGSNLQGDASYLVQQVNQGEIGNQGKTNWRLPTRDELGSLYGTSLEPNIGFFWSSSLCSGKEVEFALAVVFGVGSAYGAHRTQKQMVRLFSD